MLKTILVIVTVAIGLFRPVLLFWEFNPHIEAGYEAAAHILVGAILVLMVYQHKHAKAAFWVLVAIEVTCAAIAFARPVPTPAPPVSEHSILVPVPSGGMVEFENMEQVNKWNAR